MNYKQYIKDPTNYLALLLITLPLSFAINNIIFVLFIIVVLSNYKYLKFRFNLSYLYPIVFFLWGILSITWSYNSESSIKAISKNLAFIIVPIIFLFLPKITTQQKEKIFKNYAYGITLYLIVVLLIAFYKFITTGSTQWFFYHDLVSLNVNAIYVSIFVSMAFLFMIQMSDKKKLDWLSIIVLFISLILLSSKNILFITVIITCLYSIKNLKKIPKKFILGSSAFAIVIGLLFGEFVYKRYQDEFKNVKENTYQDDIESVSLYSAIYQSKFSDISYFTGSSFRVYQLRILDELLNEYNIFYKGFGLNAVEDKLIDKHIEDNLPTYYLNLNFHNQYAQTFAELGIIGLIILLLMITKSLIKAIRDKDFYLISFVMLTISLFITEAPLSRQRGIVFFILFYCILNQSNKIKTIK